MATSGGSHVVTVDSGGMVRVWETGLNQLARSLDEWYRLIGKDDGRPLQVSNLQCLILFLKFKVDLKGGS